MRSDILLGSGALTEVVLEVSFGFFASGLGLFFSFIFCSPLTNNPPMLSLMAADYDYISDGICVNKVYSSLRTLGECNA